jgi:GNAT superfamily N-acetyltransferase
MQVRAIIESDRDWAASVVAGYFGTPEILSRGVRHNTLRLPGLVAEHNGSKLGLLHYRIQGKDCEVVAVIALVKRQGVGRRLLAELVQLARGLGCTRVWMITTNDNRVAQEFYAAVGWRRATVHAGAVAAARAVKPEIPLLARDGTPIADEIEYEFRLITE